MKIYSAVCLSLLLLTACNKTPKEAEQKQEQQTGNTVVLTALQVKNAGIASEVPTIKAVKGTLELQGTVSVPPQSTISLSFALGGYLKKTNLQPGMYVKKGQVLATMEDLQIIQLQQDYLTTKEKYTLAEGEYKRQKGLNESKASSDKTVEQARTDRETQKILLAALAQKLSLIGISPEKLTAATISKTVAIVAPINGLVSKVNVNVGKYTSPTDMLFELVDTKDLILTLNVFEKNISQLVVGQEVTAYTNNDPDKKYHARIQYINTAINGDGAATISCKFDHTDASLLPGLYMNGEVETNSAEALSITEDAVVRWQNKFYVFVEEKEGRYEMVPVTLGNLHEGNRQITSPALHTSSKLVTKNAYTLLTKLMNSTEE